MTMPTTLISSTAALRPTGSAADQGPILEVRDLTRVFGGGGLSFLRRDGGTRAVDGVSFALTRGEAFGLVGESGSGKTTIGRMIVRLIEPTSGTVSFRGRTLGALRGDDLLAYRRSVQMVFQNPYASLNPRRRVRAMLGDAYAIHRIAKGRDADERMAALMEKVGLRPEMLDRFPHQFSSGQRQRIAIARALAVEPSLLVADEPVSALDVSVQAQVLNLMRTLQRDLGLTFVFISHDLRAVSFLCERIAVLYLGRVMEVAPRRTLIERPVHPYTRALISSVPSLTPGEGVSRELISGEISDRSPDPAGCVFAPRCGLRERLGNPTACVTQRPPLLEVAPGHVAACHFVGEEVGSTPGPAAESAAALASPRQPPRP